MMMMLMMMVMMIVMMIPSQIAEGLSAVCGAQRAFDRIALALEIRAGSKPASGRCKSTLAKLDTIEFARMTPTKKRHTRKRKMWGVRKAAVPCCVSSTENSS